MGRGNDDGGPKCPRCFTALVEGAIGPMTARGCRGCGGVWLDVAGSRRVLHGLSERELEAVATHSRQARAAHDGTSFADERGDDRAGLRCPICGQALQRSEFVPAQTEVDACAEHGTWFDRGEVERITRMVVGIAPEQGASPATTAASPAGTAATSAGASSVAGSAATKAAAQGAALDTIAVAPPPDPAIMLAAGLAVVAAMGHVAGLWGVALPALLLSLTFAVVLLFMVALFTHPLARTSATGAGVESELRWDEAFRGTPLWLRAASVSWFVYLFAVSTVLDIPGEFSITMAMPASQTAVGFAIDVLFCIVALGARWSRRVLMTRTLSL